MRRPSWLRFVFLSIVASSPISSAHAIAAAASRPYPATVRSLEDLYTQLKARRNLQLARLNHYAAHGRFPRNTHFPGRFVPYLTDEFGGICAVGYLVQQDGRNDLVESISARCNHIRIGDVYDGPLLEWIRTSGLTQQECALIQPAYATIEDYRQHPHWKDEAERLRDHFARVEKSLRENSRQSLEQVLRAQIASEMRRDPDSFAFSFANLKQALSNAETIVRIGAAYTISQLKPEAVPRSTRIEALVEQLGDPDPAVRFWTAVAMQDIGAASAPGRMQLRAQTLPVFLETARDSRSDLRRAALLQLAAVAPEAIGSNAQLRILPEIRRTLVEACHDEDDTVRETATQALRSWRWQMIACESDRMRRHYLADSCELEAAAAETLLLGRGFCEVHPAIEALQKFQRPYDLVEQITYFGPALEQFPIPTAGTQSDATKIVERHYQALYEKHWKQHDQGEGLNIRVESSTPDEAGLYYLVTASRSGEHASYAIKYLHVVPSSALLNQAECAPSLWFRSVHRTGLDTRCGHPAIDLVVSFDRDIRLGDNARSDATAFAAACDLFAHFMTYYARVVVDRTVQESTDEFTWSGRVATLRRHMPRFFEFRGGGWDFHRITLACNRATGRVRLSAEPIEFAVKPCSKSSAEIAWEADELKLMGWKPLSGIDFYGDRLLPPEYSDALESGLEGRQPELYQPMRLRHHADGSLPRPEIIAGLVYEQAGQHDDAQKCMERVVGEAKRDFDARTIADVARWQLRAGLRFQARRNAETVIAWNPADDVAQQVLESLGERELIEAAATSD